MKPSLRQRLGKSARVLAGDYSMVLVLLLLGVTFSVLTVDTRYPEGAAAARQVATAVEKAVPEGGRIMIAAGAGAGDREFANRLDTLLEASGVEVAARVEGQASEIRRELERLAATGRPLHAIACTEATARLMVFSSLEADFPSLRNPPLLHPTSHRWPNFLKSENLLNIANQVSVIAIVAIGMTMVIITAGIDLSVGSLIAFSAVVCASLIRDVAGGLSASAPGMILCCLAAIALSGGMGLFTGSVVAFLRLPPFIVTLAMMLIASGLAYTLAKGLSVYQVPDGFVWLGRGTTLFGLPNSVVLTIVLYVVAHLIMSRTVLGRHLYAVGGNREAARLAGVPVQRVLLIAYTASGMLAGVGGVILASRLKSGSPTYGLMYELDVIAAVVVGGTSLFGGEGRMFGTLVGALIIAVIRNGMNLMGVESYTQKIVLGAVILIAVTLDQLKKRQGGSAA